MRNKILIFITASILFGVALFQLSGNADIGMSGISTPPVGIGSTSITTLGTVTAGTWNGTKIGIGYGGTNATNATDARTNLGLGTIATQNADNATITGGNVTGLTNLGADHLTVTSDTILGTTNIGSTTAGKNLTVNATLENEMSPALEAENWTATDGWSAGSGVLTKIAGTGTGTATPSGTFTVTAGTTYKVVMVVSAAANSPTYTLGGVTGTTLTATTITDYITAVTTGKIIFSGGASATCTITSLTVKALTDATGDLTVEGDLEVKSKINLGSSITYLYSSYINNAVSFTINSVERFRLGGSYLNLGFNSLRMGSASNPDMFIEREAANTLALRNSTTQQIFRLYNTYTNSSNYERLSLTGVQGDSVNITAETAGTGGDNLDIVLTPAGTGQLKNTASAITSGSGTGITVNHTGAVIQQVYKVTTTYAAYSDTDLTKGIIIATLPAKTRLVAAYADTTQAYAGTDITAATLEVGVTAEGAAEILATGNVFAGAILLGDADAEMGTGMTRAAKEQGAYMPSWTGTTAIYATIDATTGAATTLANLTAGSTTFYLITERLP